MRSPAGVPMGVTLLLVLLGCGGGSPADGNGTPSGECTFTNPVASGADPWVIRQNGAYYYVRSTGRAIEVFRSTKLTDLASNRVQVWTAPDTGWNRGNVWAPELHFVDGHWYIYYAAGSSGPPYVHQRAGVLQAVSDDPQGAWVDKGQLFTGTDSVGGNIWAIDLTVGRIGSQLYAVWSGWAANAPTDATPQNLYIARMTSPWTIVEPRVLLSSPSESWERGPELDLQEGPEFLFHGSDVFLVYSTRDSWLPQYQLGQLRLSAGGNPLSPGAWTKSGPVFQGRETVYGVGHASFTTSPDGTEDWIVYHSKTSASPGWDRVVRLQKFTWRADGSPDFGEPSTAALRLPSGECAT